MITAANVLQNSLGNDSLAFSVKTNVHGLPEKEKENISKYSSHDDFPYYPPVLGGGGGVAALVRVGLLLLLLQLLLLPHPIALVNGGLLLLLLLLLHAVVVVLLRHESHAAVGVRVGQTAHITKGNI